MDLPLENPLSPNAMTASHDANANRLNEGYGVPPSDPMSIDPEHSLPASDNPEGAAHESTSTGAPSVTGSTTNRPIEPSSLFVGRLHAEVRASDLELLFSKYGNIQRCELKRGGYAFVEFSNSDSAREALKEDGTKMHGESIAVMFAKARQAEPGSSGCFRCGAPDHWSRECPHRFEDRGLGLPKWCMPGVRDRDRRGGSGRDSRRSGRGRSPSPRYSSSRRSSRRYSRSRSRSRSPHYRRSSRRYASRSPSPAYRRSSRRGGHSRSRSRSPVARSSRSKYASRSRSRSPAPRRSSRYASRSRSPVPARRGRSYSRSRSRSRSRSPAAVAGGRGRSPLGRSSRSPVARGYSRSVSRD